MHKDMLEAACGDIENFMDKLGEAFYDAFQEEDNTTYEIAKGIIRVFIEICSTEKEFETADSMLAAVCGYGIEHLLDKVREDMC